MTMSNAQNARHEIITVARNMVSGQLPLITGARRLCELRHLIGASNTDLFNPIIGFESETDEYPIGSQREVYSKEKLADMDREVAAYVAEVGPAVICTCNQIIAALENPCADH